jgi:hypothetical protein
MSEYSRLKAQADAIEARTQLALDLLGLVERGWRIAETLMPDTPEKPWYCFRPDHLMASCHPTLSAAVAAAMEHKQEKQP